MIISAQGDDVTRSRRTRVLTREGLRVVEAATAAEALQHGTSPETELTLLDMNLRDASGLDVCRQLKVDRPFKPVILISSSDKSGEARLEGLAAGADAYLTEPVPPKQLVDLVRGFVGHVSDAERHDSGWVITDPGGLIEAASPGIGHVLKSAVRNLTGRRLTDYFEDREAAASLLRGAVAGHGSLRTLRVRPREHAPLSTIVQTSAVVVPGDTLHYVRWAFTVEGRWQRVTRPVKKSSPSSG